MVVVAIWCSIITTRPSECNIDGHPTYVAGRLWLEGVREEVIYQRQIFTSADNVNRTWADALRRHRSVSHTSSYVYSPTYLWLMLPLASWLSLEGFSTLFLLLNALAAVLIGVEAARLAGIVKLRLRLLCGLLTSLTFPAIYGANLGQNILPAFALTLLGLRLLGGDTHLCKGGGATVLLLGMTFKPWLVMFVPLIALIDGWRWCLVVGAGYAVVNVALPAVVAPSFNRAYREIVSRLARASILASNNVSLRAFLQRLVTPGWVQRLSRWEYGAVPAGLLRLEWLIVGAAAVGFAAIALGRNLRRRLDSRTLLAVGSALILLPLGICWSHYLVLAVPVTVVALAAPRPPRLAGATRLLGLLELALLFVQLHGLPGRPFWPTRIITLHPRLAAFAYLLPLALPLLLSILVGISRRASGVPAEISAPRPPAVGPA